MLVIKYVEGDLFGHIKPLLGDAEKTILIPHVCNNAGGFGAGFVVPLAREYPITRGAYQAWVKNQSTRHHIISYAPAFVEFKHSLGKTQIVRIVVEEKENQYTAPKVIVFNMVAQKGLGPGRVIRYNALAACMNEVRSEAKSSCKNPEIHAPMFGAGLGGGDWNFIEKLIEDAWLEHDIPVTIYYLAGTLPGNWTLPQRDVG